MAERPMISALILNGIKAYRVINDSINPARIKKGTSPMTIFSPFTPPFLKESRREYVPGKSKLLPIVNPAAASNHNRGEFDRSMQHDYR